MKRAENAQLTSKSNKLQVHFIFFLCLAIGVVTIALSGNLTYKNEAVEPEKSEVEDNLFKKSQTPEFAPGEVIVKFKSPLGLDKANEEVYVIDSVAESTLPESVRNINALAPIKSFEKVFKGVKSPKEELQKLKARNSAQGKQTQIDEKAFLTNDLSNVYLFKLKEEGNISELITAFKADKNIEYAEPNYIYTIDAIPNDPDFPKLWGLHNTGQTGGTTDADIDAPEAWDQITDLPDVIVGVIDTGMVKIHEDLKNSMWTNQGEIAGNKIDDDGNGYIDDTWGWNFYRIFGIGDGTNNPFDDSFVGHGTHVSGTISATSNNGVGVAGVAQNVRLMTLKALGPAGTGTSTDAAKAIMYGSNNGAQIFNASWGSSSYSQLIYDAIYYANTLDILFVAAAGNAGLNTDLEPHYPSSYDLPNIVSVGASDFRDERASFSNYGGNSVDIFAPGKAIFSTVYTAYGTISGTSMAAPHVSGALAELVAKNPDNHANDHIAKMLMSSDPMPLGDYDFSVTNGRLNLNSAYSDNNMHYAPRKISMKLPTGIVYSRPIILLNTSNEQKTYGLQTAENWFNLSSTAGNIDPGQSVKIAVNVDSQNLSVGTYHGIISVSLGEENVNTIPVDLTVHLPVPTKTPTLTYTPMPTPTPLGFPLTAQSECATLDSPTGYKVTVENRNDAFLIIVHSIYAWNPSLSQHYLQSTGIFPIAPDSISVRNVYIETGPGQSYSVLSFDSDIFWIGRNRPSVPQCTSLTPTSSPTPTPTFTPSPTPTLVPAAWTPYFWNGVGTAPTCFTVCSKIGKVAVASCKTDPACGGITNQCWQMPYGTRSCGGVSPNCFKSVVKTGTYPNQCCCGSK